MISGHIVRGVSFQLFCMDIDSNLTPRLNIRITVARDLFPGVSERMVTFPEDLESLR